MQELELGGHKYRTVSKIPAFDQLFIFRKVAPLWSGVGESFTLMPRTNGDGTGPLPRGFWKALGPGAQALSDMSREDSEEVIKLCLKTCQRDNEHGSWARVMTDSGQLMFEDIDVMTMLQLAWAVIEENLGNFFAAPSPNGSAGEVVSPPSLSLR
jgi:hypothetical protein